MTNLIAMLESAQKASVAATKTNRVCAWRGCKNSFQSKAADVRRGWGLFCSKRCKAMEQESRTGQHADFYARQETRAKLRRRLHSELLLCGTVFDMEGNDQRYNEGFEPYTSIGGIFVDSADKAQWHEAGLEGTEGRPGWDAHKVWTEK